MGLHQSTGRRTSRHGDLGHWMHGVPSSWQVISSCSLRKWHQKRRSLIWGFAEYINYGGFDYGDLVQPWSTEDRHLMAYVYSKAKDSYHSESFVPCGASSKSKGKGELMFVVERPYKLDTIWYEVKLPPDYKLESLLTQTLQGQRYYTGVNVIGAKNDYILLQVTRKTKMVDIIICRKVGHVLETVGIYHCGTLPNPYFMEGVLSPSCTKLLLQPSAYYCVRFGSRPKTTEIQLIDITRNGKCSLVGPLLAVCPDPPLGSKSAFRRDHVFSFDPRYDWKRIVIGYQYASVVRVCDLVERRIVVENNSHGSLRQCTENIVYSPDGRFIASLVSSIDSGTRTKIQIWGVLVYISDSLEVVHCISYPRRNLEFPLYPACLFPIFSCSGKFLVVPRCPRGVDAECYDVDILFVPNIFNLQNLCRIAILLCTRTKHVNNLPLPAALKNFLLFKPYLG